ncbi:hypothetical protein AVEN_272988-1 [Araneus ventricosus]|uniref:Uncharacterized protein n=1 Tax=Araneus ventricosus TaxID=182803 RepID=A0A4Y2EZ35_ARAVE|nr:hypothetical protein AVEN_272988-1 [Araneus ventricosus]
MSPSKGLGKHRMLLFDFICGKSGRCSFSQRPAQRLRVDPQLEQVKCFRVIGCQWKGRTRKSASDSTTESPLQGGDKMLLHPKQMMEECIVLLKVEDMKKAAHH